MAELKTPNGLVVGLIPDELLKAKEKPEQKQEDEIEIGRASGRGRV